ncbi:cytochrome P450 [Spongiactinospora sp. TRM90649]|nr:cytochrome P450 [Spongiactinospora sp. TRM90649]MDF5756341.1 cytochrome P450 [Spongiactinospora sp. TRM90649]
MTRCVREHGDFVPIPLHSGPAYVLGHPDMIGHVLVRHPERYVRDRSIQRYRRLAGVSLLADDDDGAVLQRHRLSSLFDRDNADISAGVVAATADDRVARWADGAEPELYREMLDLTLEVMIKIIFGGRPSPRIHEHARVALELLRLAMERRPRTGESADTGAGEFAARTALLGSAIDEFIRERRSAPTGEDLLSRALAAPDPMTPERLRDELISLLVFSHETTALALTYTAYLLAAHPSAQEELAAEVRHVAGDRAVRASDVDRLPYARRLVRESLRLYPPVWILTREATRDDVISGHRVEAGARLLIPRWTIQRDPRFFDDPDEFRPHRDPARHRLAYFPFGLGPRRCLGSGPAMLEIAVVLTVFARRVSFSLPADHRLSLLPTLHLRPRDGLRLRIARI